MRFLTVPFVILLVAACSAKPRAEYTLQDVLLQENFAPGGWDQWRQGEVSARIEGEAYRIRTNVNRFVRGFNSIPYKNVIIDVRTFQTTQDKTNAYGVICRGSTSINSSNGYYFLIGADGSYSIRIGQSQKVNPLVRWAKTKAVNQGASINNLRIICIDDYLALYINGEFVADIWDSTYSAGYIGLTAATREGTVINVSFDNLIVRQGELSTYPRNQKGLEKGGTR